MSNPPFSHRNSIEASMMSAGPRRVWWRWASVLIENVLSHPLESALGISSTQPPTCVAQHLPTMLARSILLRTGQQLPCFSQLRLVSTKTPRSPLAKSGGTGGRKPGSSLPDAAAQSGSQANATTSTSSQQTLLRNRKLTPAAKAKAQASASRALREQLASVNVGTASAEDSALAAAAAAPSSSVLPGDAELGEPADRNVQHQPLRRLHDAVAYATAESYDFDRLIASGRLPPGWQLLEDDEVIYIPQWPQSASAPSPSHSAGSTGGEAFIFRSGSYVTWGMSSEQSRKFLRMVLQGRPGMGHSAEVDSYSEIGDEAMEYVVADDQ